MSNRAGLIPRPYCIRNMAIYKPGVFRQIKKQLSQEILSAAQASPELRKQINATISAANKRLRRLDEADVYSPAAVSLGKERGGEKFSTAGKDWDSVKREYARAVAFMRQPTSTVGGTRQYNEYLRVHYGMSPTEWTMYTQYLRDELISIDATDFVQRYLSRYKDFTGEFARKVSDVASNIESDAKRIQADLQAQLQAESEAAAQQVNASLEQLEEALRRLNDWDI